jgi:hypothetical protein
MCAYATIKAALEGSAKGPESKSLASGTPHDPRRPGRP